MLDDDPCSVYYCHPSTNRYDTGLIEGSDDAQMLDESWSFPAGLEELDAKLCLTNAGESLLYKVD